VDTRKYKVRLRSGRVLGPMGLDRICLFILRDKITGLEEARSYPKGDWKDINKFPEIARMLLDKLEGRLEAPKVTAPPEELDNEIRIAPTEDLPDSVEPPGPPKTDASFHIEIKTHTATPMAESSVPRTKSEIEERTVVMTPNDEKTVVQPRNELDEKQSSKVNQLVEVEAVPQETPFGQSVANEPTQMIQITPTTAGPTTYAKIELEGKSEQTEGLSLQGLLANKRKLSFILIAGFLVLFILFAPAEKKPEKQIPFKVTMPAPKEKSDPQKSSQLYVSALKFYNEDTVEGYKKAAGILLESVANDSDNVKALCLLASAYMHLIDVVDRDENYFNVVTRLIELERAKNVNLPETVVADVELYLILGNPDAAMSRIVEFTKNRTFGVEMFYYLALSFFHKGMHPDALKYLNNIDPKDYFSPRIHYLYGQIYYHSRQLENAVSSLESAIQKSPKHIKARVLLADTYFKKDSYEKVVEHSSFVIQNKALASNEEEARSYYLRARSYILLNKLVEAHSDLQKAHKLSPDDQDILLEFYTLKARVGEQVGEAASRARMFSQIAVGERALREGRLKDAKVAFLSARNIQGDDPTPLLRLAEVFKRTGEAAEARAAYEKAVKLGSSSRIDFYPKYIHALVDAYEFEEAQRQIEIFKGLRPPTYAIDKIYGDFYLRQEKLREAHGYYKRALSATNVDSGVYNSYAKIMFKTGSFREAAFYYGLARRFDPFNPDATIGIGKSLAELEGVERGVGYLSSELATNPNKAALFNGIAEIYVRKGDYETAVKFANNALAVDPKYAQSLKTRGDAFAAQERYKEALEEYQRYADAAPLDPNGNIERYKIFMRRLNLKDAKDEIQKVIKNYPRFPGAYYMLGELFREAQNWQGALQAADREIQNNPLFAPAYVLGGTVFNANREYTRALEYLNKALRVDPSYVPALIQAGFANQMLKTYAAAKSMYERALAQDPGNPKIHKHLGVLLFELGDRAKAAEYLKNYIDLFPDAPDRAEVERKLQGL